MGERVSAAMAGWLASFDREDARVVIVETLDLDEYDAETGERLDNEECGCVEDADCDCPERREP